MSVIDWDPDREEVLRGEDRDESSSSKVQNEGMNFIDRVLAKGEALSDDGFLQAMADIYKEPQVWQELGRYPQYIQDVIYIIDYDTEVQMEGLDAFVTGPHAEQYEQTCQALLNCGAVFEAEFLKRVKDLADRDPGYEDETVSEEIETLCRLVAQHRDRKAFWDLVRAYIKKSRKVEKRSVHAGHRKRMKEEYLAQGLEGWKEHRILELLLFYAIPQGDTNPLAHELIDRFDSLYGVLDAPMEELCRVKGVNTHTAILLRLITELGGRYLAERSSMGTIVTNSDQVQEILSRYFSNTYNEKVYLLCLDGKHKLLGVRKLTEGSINAAEITARRLVEEALTLRATAVILAHNHPSGLALPSKEDHATTLYLKKVLAPIGIELLDHVIFCDGEMVSMRDSKLL